MKGVNKLFSMECKVSIIIPVYNSEKYLGKLIECLSSQTLKEIEFIFVNDCSTDNSLNILSDFEKKDEDRVIIINLNENQGQGGARNIGLKYARGEYIAFADSDDYMKSDMYESLYNKAALGNYDIVECGYYSERKNKNMMLWDKNMDGDVSFDNRIKMFLSCGFLWSKLFKRDIIFDSNIEFIDRIQFEDVDFLNRLYLRVNRAGVLEKYLYYYRNDKESITNRGNHLGHIKVNEIFSIEYLNHMKQEKDYLIYKPVIEYAVLGIWYDVFLAYVTKNKSIDIDFLNIIDKEVKKFIPDYADNLFFVEQAKNDKIKEAFLVNSNEHEKALNIINESVN